MRKILLFVIIIISMSLLITAKTPNNSIEPTNQTKPIHNHQSLSSNASHQPKSSLEPYNPNSHKSANKDLVWASSQNSVLQSIDLSPNFADKESLWYKNQIVINQRAMLSYFFNEDKLWRKIIMFEDNSRPNMLKLHKLLVKRYGQPSKGYDQPTWQHEGSNIFIYCDNNYLRLIYDDATIAQQIMAQVEENQLKEL